MNRQASAFVIRPFKSPDYSGLQKLWASTSLGSAARGDDLTIIKHTLAQGGKLWVATPETTDEIIGSAWLTNDGRRLLLHHIGVTPEKQGMGIGTALTLQAIAHAKLHNMQIKLEVHNQNQRAISIYDRLGFKRLGDYDTYIIRSFE